MSDARTSAAPVPDLVPLCADLRTAFLRAGFHTDGVLALLGADVNAALGRNEAVPVRRVLDRQGSTDPGGQSLATLVRLFLLGDTCPESAAAAALAPLDLDAAVAGGLLQRHGGAVRAALDVRPLDTGAGTRWVVSDLDADRGELAGDREYVPGVGQASVSLLQAIPALAPATALDLGTGCGVQALQVGEHAGAVTATDVSPRALAMAAATFALNQVSVELLAGSWFEPVAGRRFDQVVANPPFVVGPAEVHSVYRDSGLDLDGASELVIRGIPEHLNPGGTATLLASWVHVRGQDWRQRVASWLPEHGIDAWVVQRDVAEPALYVSTWLRDGGLDPRTGEGARRYDAWLEHLERSEVTGIGFGYVTLRATDAPSDVLAEDLLHPFTDPLGPEAQAYLARVAWLREHDLLDAQLAVAPGVVLQRVAVATDEGWKPLVARVTRTDGPRWEHEVDELAVSLLAGLRPDGLPLGELVGMLELAHGEDEGALTGPATALVHDLLRHGLVLPADLAGDTPTR
ncbi:methyltransferase [Rhodococcus sp. X156]|uniref:DUF7782 domain-containing protein n=1 Tax=Rhodococcus sp. X156 TaxID=2499145 RepID=UPI000FD91D25|nr:methyltransferase [Rhodococcus sp. X156]